MSTDLHQVFTALLCGETPWKFYQLTMYFIVSWRIENNKCTVLLCIFLQNHTCVPSFSSSPKSSQTSFPSSMLKMIESSSSADSVTLSKKIFTNFKVFLIHYERNISLWDVKQQTMATNGKLKTNWMKHLEAQALYETT